MNITRARLQTQVQRALGRARAVVLAGPRQSGKSTLAASLVPRGGARWFDLEDPVDQQRLQQPMTALTALSAAPGSRAGPVVIDEVQLAPGLFPVLRVLIDRSPANGQFLLLGSASPALLRQAGESLLGRVEVIEVGGFDIEEVGPARQSELWLRGGYPRAFLAASDADSMAWRTQAIQRHVETDLPQFGVNVAAPAMLRFWRMLAHCHGQVWSAADPARSLAVSEPTVRRHLDVLTQTFMLRQLQPWHQNLGKRQVKAPKIYFRDTGLLHTLMGVPTLDALLAHPRSGASWEGFALEQVLRIAAPDEAYFWATHNGAELDLLLFKDGQRIGVEFKRADAPGITPSMRIAMHDLQLDQLYVVYPGSLRYTLTDRMEVVPLAALLP
ncbi:MAG: ATP-binding protein [Rubrivivax sp.]|nr:ATP-binding protein [Rubrivivax sp.]